LKQIGCSGVAILTQRAIDLLGIKYPVTSLAIENVLSQEENLELEDNLHECDKEYYNFAGDLSSPLLKYIKNNKQQFLLDSNIRKSKKAWWKFWKK
jgi:hypothetical protein